MSSLKDWSEEQRHHVGTFSVLSKCLSNFTDDDRNQYHSLHKAIAGKMEEVLTQINVGRDAITDDT